MVTLFFRTIFRIYMHPSSHCSVDEEKVAAVVCTLVILMLNSLIYSLRSEEVKAAFGRLMHRKTTLG